MALVTPDCFDGLSTEDKVQQLYEAAYDRAENSGGDVSDLTLPSCFKSLSNEDKEQQIYASLYANT